MLIGRLSQMRPAPLSLWHCDPELCSIEKRFQVNGATLGRSCPPGVQVYPIVWYVLTEPVSLFKCGKFTFLRNPLSELWVCEFWLLRWSTMVARAWPVCVEVIQDWLLAAPSQTSPPSCFYDTSILRYPFDLFKWKSMGRVAKVL